MKPPAFNPESFFAELPQELRRRIFNFACNSRSFTFEAGVGAIESRAMYTAGNLTLFEQDLHTVGALRATGKNRPFKTFSPDNRYVYFNFVLEVWTVRKLSTAQRVYNRADFPGVSRRTLNNLYNDSVWDECRKVRAIQAAAQKDPDAMKRALQALRRPGNPTPHNVAL